MLHTKHCSAHLHCHNCQLRSGWHLSFLRSLTHIVPVSLYQKETYIGSGQDDRLLSIEAKGLSEPRHRGLQAIQHAPFSKSARLF